MRKKKKSEPLKVENVKFTTDASPENNPPEKIQQKLCTLIEVAISIARRRGLLRSGLTVVQAHEEWRRRDLEPKLVSSQAPHISGKGEYFEIPDPVQKEIRVRLPRDKWSQIVEEARRLRISPTELTRRWILERLSRRT